MGFGVLAEKFNSSRIKRIAVAVFNSYYFPFVTAALTALCSIVGWELVIIWYICLCGAGIVLCCKDVTPVVSLLIFMHVFVSMQHSPDQRGVEWCDPTYMTSAGFIVPTAIAALIFVVPVLYRTVDGIVKRRFRLTPVFWGLCAYGAALVLNGLFSADYYYMNVVYALGMAAILIVVFVFIGGNVKPGGSAYKKIAVYFVALSAALAVQLVASYIQFGVVDGGSIERSRIKFGWGTYNQFGMLTCMCLPSWFYLAIKQRRGWAYLFGALFNLALTVMSMSRQAILTSAVVAPACLIWFFISADAKKRVAGGIVTAVAAAAALTVCLLFSEAVAEMFKGLEASILTGSGRLQIWKEGFKKFLHHPLFGNGIYDITATENHSPGYCGAGAGFTESVPFMCHNTVVQLLFSCGLVGLAAYIVHRVQTVISLFKNPSAGRIFIAFTVCGMLLTSLLDNHIFYPFPLFIYASLLSVFTVSEKKDGEAEDRPAAEKIEAGK